MSKIARQAILALAVVLMASGSAIYTRADAAAKTLTGVVTDMACGRSHAMMKGSGSDAECVRRA